jgi:hypothetical protein
MRIRKQVVMAGRTLNRHELRKQADAAEQLEPVASDAAVTTAAHGSKAKKKDPATPKVRKARAKKLPPRMCARWGVFDATMKQVAVFDYNQKVAADEKLALLVAAKKGAHFLQIVKEPMVEPPPAALSVE